MAGEFQFDPETGLLADSGQQGFQFDPNTGLLADSPAAPTPPPAQPAPDDWWGDYWGHLKDHASRAYNNSLDGKPVSMPETDPITAKDLLDKRTALQQQIFDGADPNTDGETRAQAKLAAQRLAKIDHVLGTMGTPTGELATGVQKPGDIIDALPHEKLMASDRYQQAYDAASPVLGADDAHAYAKNVVANDAHFIPYMSDSIFSDLMGAPKATAFDKNYNPPAPPTPQAELSAVEPGYASETAPDFGTGKVSKEELAAFGRTTAGRYGQIVAYDVLEGTEEFAKLPALTAAGVLSIFGDHAEAARDFLFKYGVKPQDDMVAMAEANKPLPVGIGEQAVDKVAKMIPGLVAMAATYNPEMLLTPATELFSMPLWRQVWQQAVETTVQQMPAGAVGSLPGAIERGQQIAEKGGSAAATALGTAEELATGTVQMSMPMARGGAWWEKAISGGSAFTAQDIAASAAAGQPITPASIIASMAVGAAMGQMHQEQQKILLPKFANAMSALEHDPENMSRLTWVAETMKDKGAAGGLWATAELHNITVKGETRDEAAYQEWKAAKAVTEPTAAEQAPGEGQTTLQAAEDLVGAPGQPLNVTPPPIGSPGALDTTAIHVLPPLPPDEHPGAQVPPAPEGEPIPATGLEAVAKERLQPPVAPVGAPAVRVTDVQATEAAHAQAEADRARQEAEIEHERQSGDVQTAASIAASEDAAREAAARGQGPPIPTTLAAAMETAKRVPPKPKPEPPKLTEGTVTGGEAPTPVREGEQTIEGHRPSPPTSPEFQLSEKALTKGPEVKTEAPDLRLAAPEGEEPELKQALGAPAGDTGIPKDLPSAKTEQTDKLSAALNEHAPDPTGAKIDLEEIHRDHLPPEVQTAINEVEKFTGTQVHVIRDNTPGWEGRVRFNGAMYNGHLFVNESSQHPIVHTLAHEWTHQLKRTAPPLYQILENEIKRQGGVEAFGQSAVGRGYRPEKHAEELTADTNGDALGDRAFMERMAKENPTAFGKLASSFGKYLDTFLGKVSDYGTNRYVKDVDAYRQVLSAVMHTHAFDAGIKSGTMRRVGAPSLRKAPDDEEEQAVAAAAGKAERTTSPEQLGGFGRGGEVADNARYQGGARAGQYIGAPAKYNTPAKIGGLRRLFRQLTQEGESGRYWYRDSGAWILQHAGSVEEARKLAKVLAIYSPQAKVDANTTMALHAWEQYKAGQPINAKTGVQDAYASRVLYGDGVFEGGEKTNNFYNNLMRHVDPASHAKQGATIDLWMMRAAGYHTDSPTDAAYRFVENEVNRVAQEMGWSPEEVQAAIWVAMKARTENKGVKERTEAESTKKGYMRYDTNPKGEEVRNVLDEGKHRGVWLKHAMALDVSAEDTRAASYDFGNALNDRAAQLSHESIPSVESGVLPGIHDAPMEQKIEYHRAIQDALKNEDGRDAIDTEVGPFAGPGVEGFSGWEGKSTVGTQHAQPIYTKDGKVSENSRRLIELSQSIRGQLLNQKAMAWHYPIYDGSKYVQNGAEINLGRHLTEEENAAFYTALAKHLGHSEAPPIPTVDGQGVRVLNFPAIPKGLTQGKLVSVTRKANDDFHSAVQMAIHDQPWHNEVSDYTRFQSDGEYISSEAANGPANYRGRIEAASRAIEEARPRSWAGRSDIQDWIEKDLRPRVDAVNQDFAKRYGWDKGRAEGVTEAPELSLAAEENVPPHSDKTEDGEPVRTIKSSIGNLHIETDKGQTRTGTTEEGKPFSTVMKHPYGYVEGVPGRDGGSMDVLVAGEAADPSRPVFVIHQKNAAGGFDEHKVVVGAKNQRDAERAYLSEYPKGWDRMGQVEQFTPAQFKEWARTTGREQAQVGKVDPAVPRANIRGQQPDAVAMHAVTDRALPERTANEHGRLDLPNAVKGIASRTQFTSAEGGGGKHETVLRNLYDAKADPRGLFDIARDNLDAHSLPVDLPHIMNEFERLVISHGFDGYKTPDGQATVLGAKVPTRAKTTEVGHGLATERTESGAGRITGVAGENAGRDNAPVREGETTARAAETKGDETTGEGTVKDEGVRVPDEQKGQTSHQGLTAEHEASSIANVDTEAARLARGKEMIEKIRGKTGEELHAAAHEELRKNPNRGREIANEVANTPRNISDVEAAILAVDRQRIVRAHDDATKRASDAMDLKDHDATQVALAMMKLHEAERDTNEKAAVHAGTEWSNSGLARRLLVNSDESYGGLLAARKVKAGRDLSETERAEIKKDADERKRLKDKLASPGLKEKPEMVVNNAKKKFADALEDFKKLKREEMMTKECYL
jgi:hypothetical protein